MAAMSKHWRPDPEAGPLRPSRARREWTRVPCCWTEHARGPMPEGGKAGLLLIAAACLGVAIAVYHVWGPRDIIARGPADWKPAKNPDEPQL